MTAERAEALLAPSGARVDFYDLNPGFAAAPTPATTQVTPGTDRRCELAFDGDRGGDAAQAAAAGLSAEGIDADARLPPTHADAALPGTTLLAARALNPRRLAVVHTGTRPGPNGTETFLNVERLTPDASREALQ
ncbi:succinyl-CoA synthetase subunit beta [Jannaschia ovalis]|uniref:Succinyl-CoA synthetase subunit beta n=1 Tax=Jannaschia ovalis TaxID=3038773 RepID=A0ABY8LI62_9RHOB|nr:succinyl-CoA synthetase subunit beta [Jannaschia sp. GRR-S6-38]WGH80088.1 succinyl-CoA synthetase subunit beta [Jannaschia sp. GRR-S6-38]